MATWHIALLCFGVLSVLSVWADHLFRAHPEIPVHWNYKLQPDGFLKRRLGLAFLPLFSVVVLLVLGLIVDHQDAGPTRGDPALGIGLTAGTFVLCHVGHIWAIHRHFR